MGKTLHRVLVIIVSTIALSHGPIYHWLSRGDRVGKVALTWRADGWDGICAAKIASKRVYLEFQIMAFAICGVLWKIESKSENLKTRNVQARSIPFLCVVRKLDVMRVEKYHLWTRTTFHTTRSYFLPFWNVTSISNATPKVATISQLYPIWAQRPGKCS